MSRYIDADELLKKAIYPFIESDLKVVTVEDIKSAPTADVRLIDYGEWELVDDTFDEMKDYKCNLCGQLCAMSIYKMMNFCPNCGARMKGVEE